MNSTNNNHLQENGSTNVVQHYRMTLADAIFPHQQGWITATALLYYYLKIRLAPTWKITLNQKEVEKLLGIKKTAFYRAINQLTTKELIQCENGLTITLCQSQIPVNETQIPVNETQIPVNETQIPVYETQIPVYETKTGLKPLSGKDSGDAPNYIPNSISNSLSEEEREFFENSREFRNSIKEESPYQSFLNGLLDEDREKFLKFAMAMVDKLPFRPTLPSAWIERNYEGIHDEYIRLNPPKPDYSHFENEPEKEAWLAEIRQIGRAFYRRSSR